MTTVLRGGDYLKGFAMLIRRVSLAGACFAAAMLTAGAASATPVTLTWNPTAVGLGGSGAFTFTDITGQDFANVTLTPNGSGGMTATEHGYLRFNAFSNGLDTVTTPGLNSINPSPAANAYQLYVAFDATATLNSTASGFAGT